METTLNEAIFRWVKMKKPAMAVHTSNPSAREVETRESLELAGQPLFKSSRQIEQDTLLKRRRTMKEDMTPTFGISYKVEIEN